MVSCSSKCSWSSAKLSPAGSASPLPEQLLMPGGYGPSGQPEGVVKAAGASLVVGDCAVPAKASERTKAATTSQGLWWGKCMRDIPVLLAGRKPKRWFVSTKAMLRKRRWSWQTKFAYPENWQPLFKDWVDFSPESA